MKERLDLIVVSKGLAPSREKARALIMEGLVYVNGQKEDKPGAFFDDASAVELRGNTLRYVSRGGLKLEKALQVFRPALEGAVCMDIGASTGGFTDCMLKNGAAKVYAVDVGYGQLAWQLRNDPRVVCLEKTNIRYITEKEVPEPLDFFSVDVSFISLTKVLPPVLPLLKVHAEGVLLIKPQFEAGREKVGKKGVVREEATHIEVIEAIVRFVPTIGLIPMGLDYSPVRGPEGNIEYLLYVRRDAEDRPVLPEIPALVAESHRQLSQGT